MRYRPKPTYKLHEFALFFSLLLHKSKTKQKNEYETCIKLIEHLKNKNMHATAQCTHNIKTKQQQKRLNIKQAT